jgi:hypothetical protein
MAVIRFVPGSSREFVPVLELFADDLRMQEVLASLSDDEREGARFTHHPGSDDEPQLFEVRYPPGTRITPHAHDADEILVVVEGELHFGKQVYGPHSSVFIPRFTLYAFRAGPDGVTFLNFRPIASRGALSKEDLMARRSSNGTESSHS